MNKLNKISFFAFLIISFTVCSLTTYAQYPQYDKNYFLFPIKPGHRNYLSGNMGELRNNHFHGGIDIKTDQREGLPVYASADGYISRIVVAHRGYGNTLYITHPNGLTTVYAHLLWFHDHINKYMLKYLYSEQCNEADVKLTQDILKVKKGDIIALSGNTGSSGGPHLHWEVRDEWENLLNPLFFNFDEIDDNLAPVINLMAMKTLSINSRVEGEFGLVEFKPVKSQSGYVLNYPIHAYGHIGLQLVTYDRLNGTSNLCGVSSIQMKVDGKEHFVHDIQKISFSDQYYINAHIDYSTLKKKGNYYQKCYIDDGNELNTYCAADSYGKLYIADTNTHHVEIIVADAYNNITSLKFKIKGSPYQKVRQNLPKKKMPIPTYSHTVDENILKMQVPAKYGYNATLYTQNQANTLFPAYVKDLCNIYLWDLRKALPDSLRCGKMLQIYNYMNAIPSRTIYSHTNPYMNITFNKKSIFDTLYLQIDYMQGVYTLHHPFTPLFEPMTILLKSDKEVLNKPKTAVYSLNGLKNSRLSFAGGEWDNGNHIKFKSKYFGKYTIASDTSGPRVYMYKKSPYSLYIKAIDYPSDVALWYAYLNGQFLLLHYDSKYDILYTNPLEKRLYKGSLIVGVTDNLGNITIKNFKL
ncbi:MAG: M23 family metallopeptidase [Cytophagales bacterium]|nr:M23 family metallopeptidase [Cytophagales bacterium]